MKNEGVPLPAPGSPAAPNYWAYETGGLLKPAMYRYMAGQALNAAHVAVIRAYLRQWIDSPVWDSNPHMNGEGAAALARLRASVDSLTTAGAITEWLDLAEGQGMDPL